MKGMTDGWTYRLMDYGWTMGWMYGCMDGRRECRMDGCIDHGTDGWMDGRNDGWMVEWSVGIDGWMV